MTTEPSTGFYANDLLIESAVYTVVSEGQPIDSKPKVVQSRLLRRVAACAMSSIAVFGPFAASSPVSSPAAEQVIVHVKGASPTTAVVVDLPVVAIPDAHRRAVDRFKKMFRAVPLHDGERTPDPDFGL